MKTYPILLAMAISLCLGSCGADDELAAETNQPVAEKEADTTPQVADNGKTGFSQVLAQVTEIKNVFHTKDFDQNGKYLELDTAFVREYQVVKPGYIFEMPESWQAVGKIYLTGYVYLIVNYSNPSANNLELFVYNEHGQPLCSLPLAINMLSEGQVPVEATVNPEGLVSVLYKDQRSSVRKNFELDEDELVLVKTIEMPK